VDIAGALLLLQLLQTVTMMNRFSMSDASQQEMSGPPRDP